MAGYTYTATPVAPLPWIQLDLPTTVQGYAFGVHQAATGIGSIVVLDGLDVAAYVNRLFDEPVQIQRDTEQNGTQVLVLTNDVRATWQSVNGIPVVAAIHADGDLGQWMWTHGGHTWIAVGTLAMNGFVNGLVAAQQASLPASPYDYELLAGALYQRLVPVPGYLYIDLSVAEALNQIPNSFAGDYAKQFYLGYVVLENDPDPLVMAPGDLGLMAATIGGVCADRGFFADLDTALDAMGMRDDVIAGVAVRRDDANVVVVNGDDVFHFSSRDPATFAVMEPFIVALVTSLATSPTIVPTSTTIVPTSVAQPSTVPPVTATTSVGVPPATQQPTGLGDDPTLNVLAQSCFDGDMASCDQLFEDSAAGSPYQHYGDTCAGRQPLNTGAFCTDAFDSASGQPTVTISAATPPASQQPIGLGDDPTLNAFAQSCFDGDMASCDRLYENSPAGSLYEQYADTCAGRQSLGTGRYCVEAFPGGSVPTTTVPVSGPAPSTVASSTPSSTAPPPTAIPGNGNMFTVGEIAIPPGEPGQLSVVLGGEVDDSGHQPIVIRNNRDHTVYDINVTVTATDASGAQVAVAEYFIQTAGVAPGGWTFGQNGTPAPGLSDATNFQLRLSGSPEPGDFVGLDVTAAQMSGDAIVGTVTNNSAVTLGNFNLVDVACFEGQQVTAYELAMAEAPLLRLLPGESAQFSTTIPIDPATCSSFAVYAVGLPAS